ncbi:MAG TPA: hypothetical protein DDY91_10125 [Planctomycetaceae bacterium]|nr:hypothetical protein [Planctomycetaceae bacterium]
MVCLGSTLAGTTVALGQVLPAEAVRPARQGPSAASRRLFCVLIGGMDSDPTPEQLAGTARRDQGNSGLYRLRADLQESDVEAVYFNWNGTRAGELAHPQPPHARAIVDCLREHGRESPRDRLAVVGNSWGGHTAYEVARTLAASDRPLALDLVVFLDPSSTGRALVPPRNRPITINRSVNYYTRNRFVWGPLKIAENHDNIDLGDPSTGYLRPDGAKYQSPFDFPAHVAAEWDERIHSDIRRRLMELCE